MLKGFRTEAPGALDKVPHALIRVGKGKQIRFWCVSTEPIVMATHWTSKGSVRCTEDDCELCAAGKRPRWRGYVFGTNDGGKECDLFEYTEGVSGVIKGRWQEFGTLRGHGIELTRRGPRKNAPLVCRFSENIRPENQLPDCPEIIPLLCRIYDVRFARESDQAAETPTVDFKRA